jgi:hypothetical protein
MSNGKAGGYLYENDSVHTLGILPQFQNSFIHLIVSEPAENEKIIGFYGRSEWGLGFDGIEEFGIITARRHAPLPMAIYDLPELQNTDGGNGPVSCASLLIGVSMC